MKILTDEDIDTSGNPTEKETSLEKPETDKGTDKGTDKPVPESKPKKDNSLTIILLVLLAIALAIYAWSENKDTE